MNIDISKCPKDQPVKIFYPDGKLLTETNDVIMFNYIRSEIAKNRWDGFYVTDGDNQKFEISSNGIVKSGGKLFTSFTDVLSKLTSYAKRVS